MTLKFSGACLSACLLVSACSTAPGTSPHITGSAEHLLLDPAYTTGSATETDAAQMLRVTEEMRRYIHARVPAEATEKRKVDLVLDAILQKGLNLSYDSSRTLTAAETFHAREGNCLSFTNLYVALAREVGLRAEFQEVRFPPVWEENNDIWQLNRHINVSLQVEGQRVTVDFDPAPMDIPRWRRFLSDEKVLARYHSNLGVGALYDEELATAYGHFVRALEIDPEQGFFWNNLGTLYRHAGRAEQAEAAYLEAVSLDGDPTAMSNLAALYREQGNREAADYLAARVTRYRNKNPYYLYTLAWQKYEAGEHRASERLVRKALATKTEDHRFYWLWALNRLGQNDPAGAGELLERAGEVARAGADRDRYQHKLQLLAAHRI